MDENNLWAHLSLDKICGIDEAGRGPLAGPVTAAAVILPVNFPLEILGDSKKLTPLQRRKAVSEILAHSVSCGLGWAWPEEIDDINIHFATLRAMERAYRELKCRADFILVDGKFSPSVEGAVEAVVKGDSKIPAIMAASILAKTARDRWMERYSWIDGRYLFEKHKGYPTREHAERCKRYGLSAIHRRSFHVPDWGR
jgi:ribonuclease HII